MDELTFTQRRNAKRAAEKKIANGTAPSIDYGLREREDGRFEIVWHREAAIRELEQRLHAAADQHEMAAEEGATVACDSQVEQYGEPKPPAEAEAIMAEGENYHAEDNGFGPDPWPPGARVRVALARRRTRLGTVDYQVDHKYWRVFLDGAAAKVSALVLGEQLSDPGAEAPAWVPPEKKRPHRERLLVQRSKNADLDAAAAAGVLPEKPVCTSEANKAQYQPRFDYLAEKAEAGDWDAVRTYEVKGINSYAKMVKRYQARLLAAHAAQHDEE